MPAPATAKSPDGGRVRRLLLRFVGTALFACGLWLCSTTIAAATEQPDGPQGTAQHAVDAAANITAAATHPSGAAAQDTGQGQDTGPQPPAESQHTESQHTEQAQQAGQASGTQQAPGASGNSSPGLLSKVHDTVHDTVDDTVQSAVRHTPVLEHTLAKQQAAHERPEPAVEQRPQSPLPQGPLPQTEPNLPAALGSPAHFTDKHTPGPSDTGENSTTSEPARQHTAAATTANGKTHRAKPQRGQPHRSAARVPRSGSAPSNVVTATPTHAEPASQATDHSVHGDHQRTEHLPPGGPNGSSAYAGHAGANGDRGGNGGVFAVTTASGLPSADPAAASARGAAVRYRSTDRLRPGVAPD